MINAKIFLNDENKKSLISRKCCKIERFRQNFCPTGCTQRHVAVSAKNRFATIFGGHHEFLRKMQNLFIVKYLAD